MKSLIIIILCSLSSSLYAQQDTLEEFVEFKIAEYAGGEQGMQMCLAQHVTYPAEALENDVMGTVYVRFVIDTFGRVTDLELNCMSLRMYKIKKGSAKKRKMKKEVVQEIGPEGNDYGLVAAALAGVQQCEDWEPAIQKGKKVNMRYKIPVIFRIF